jgi:hypothetical protein
MMTKWKLIRKVARVCLAAGAALIVANNSAHALDCSEKVSRDTGQSPDSYVGLDKIISRLKAKDPGALANGTGRIVLIRRFVSGEAAARGGNIAAELPLTRIGKGLTISYGKQKIIDFSIDPVFADMDLSTIVRVRQGVCGDSASCSSFPTGDGLDRFLADLIECNDGKKGVFEFDDAFVVLDMARTGNLAIGEGVIIQKKQGKLQPKVLVISQ